MITSLLAHELRDLLVNDRTNEIKEFCEDTNSAAVAELLTGLEPDEIHTIILLCAPESQVEIFSFLPFEQQQSLLERLKRREISRILTDMPPDDRADLFKHLPEEMSEDILPALAHAEREDIRRLSSYDEGTAGAVMTSDYAFLSPGLTASQAIEHLKHVAPDKETIYYSYVVDSQRRLLGCVSLQNLIVAKHNETVADIMQTDPIYTHTYDDQEDAARKIQRYDLFAIPVLDADNALMGIITYDDAIDVITNEQTEDLEKLMAITGEHESAAYMSTSFLKHFRNRSIWVTILAVLGLISGAIIQRYEDLLAQFTILASFIPMLAAAGGNTGSQSSTLVIRALALKEISPRDVLPVLGKEFCVSLLLGLLLGTLAYLRVILFGGGSSLQSDVSIVFVGLSVSTALCLQVVTATLMGALLPLVAARFRIDPAVIASPMLSTIVDITGLLLYFTTASYFLGII
jgi:magnesium transporter